MKPYEHMWGLIGDTIYVRTFGPFPAGRAGPNHLHHIEHATLIQAGTARLRIWDEGADLTQPPKETVDIEAPNFVVAPANAYHQFEALIDGTVWVCIFSQDEGAAAVPGTDDERVRQTPKAIFGQRKPDATRP